MAATAPPPNVASTSRARRSHRRGDIGQARYRRFGHRFSGFTAANMVSSCSGSYGYAGGVRIWRRILIAAIWVAIAAVVVSTVFHSVRWVVIVCMTVSGLIFLPLGLATWLRFGARRIPFASRFGGLPGVTGSGFDRRPGPETQLGSRRPPDNPAASYRLYSVVMALIGAAYLAFAAVFALEGLR